MMKFKSVMMATIMAIIFNGSAYAQLPDWLEGKWLANTVYEIKGDTIKKIEYGITVNLGEFTINEDSVIVIDGKESNLIVLNDDQALAYKTNPAFKFPKYDNLTLPEKYKWVAGSWTDGESVITFTEKNVTIKQGEYVVNSGIFYVDDSGMFDVFWDKNDREDSFIINGNVVAYEGGDNLYKLPEQQKQAAPSEVSDNNPISSLNTSSKPYEGDIKWLYGVWVHNGTEIYITPKYYQARRENDTYLADKDLFELDKIQYVVTEEDNQILGKVIRLDDFYLDPTSKLIYTLSNVDKRLYMEKISNYVSPVISYGKWVLVGLVAIAIIIFLIFFLVRLVKIAISYIKQWRQQAKEKLAIKAQEAKKNVYALKDKAKELSNQTQSAASEFVKGKDREVYYCLLIGLYLLLFFSIILGILILVPTIVYLILKKKRPEKAESIRSVCSSKLALLESHPHLKRGFIIFIVGLLAFRLISINIGLIIILLACVYLICSKFSSKVSDKIDEFISLVDKRAIIIWSKPYAKILMCCFLLVFPFINKAPTNSIVTIATPTVEQITGIEPEQKELRDPQIPSFSTPMDVLLFLSKHTFRSDENGLRMKIRNDAVYVNGKPITTIPQVTDFSEDEATLKAYTPLSNKTYEIWLVRNGNTYLLKVMDIPSYRSIENYYMVN